MSQTPESEFQELIERSSLGTKGARLLRSRTLQSQTRLVSYIVRRMDKLTAARMAGDRNGILDALAGLAAAYQVLYRDDEAADLYQEMLALCHEAGDQAGERHALAGLAATGREAETEKLPVRRPQPVSHRRPRPVSNTPPEPVTRPEPRSHTVEELLEKADDEPAAVSYSPAARTSARLPSRLPKRPRGKRDDDDDWPNWDRYSDEQYWTELSADKPLAARGRGAKSPSRKSSEPAAPAAAARAAAAPPAAGPRQDASDDDPPPSPPSSR
jgi:hypothetical protein